MDSDVSLVTVSEWNWYFDNDGDIRLAGFIRNDSSQSLAAASPQFRLLNGDGKFVGVACTARQFDAPLPPGAAGAFAFWELVFGRDVAEVESMGVVDVKFVTEE
ncbi:MAG: hypothetical protein ACYC5O_03220 [Anaerolineae bacterium]